MIMMHGVIDILCLYQSGLWFVAWNLMNPRWKMMKTRALWRYTYTYCRPWFPCIWGSQTTMIWCFMCRGYTSIYGDRRGPPCRPSFGCWKTSWSPTHDRSMGRVRYIYLLIYHQNPPFMEVNIQSSPGSYGKGLIFCFHVECSWGSSFTAISIGAKSGSSQPFVTGWSGGYGACLGWSRGSRYQGREHSSVYLNM